MERSEWLIKRPAGRFRKRTAQCPQNLIPPRPLKEPLGLGPEGTSQPTRWVSLLELLFFQVWCRSLRLYRFGFFWAFICRCEFINVTFFNVDFPVTQVMDVHCVLRRVCDSGPYVSSTWVVWSDRSNLRRFHWLQLLLRSLVNPSELLIVHRVSVCLREEGRHYIMNKSDELLL